MWLYEELDDSSNTGLNPQNICNYFEIFSNQLKIDCASLTFKPKPRAIALNHIIRKRDVENSDNLDSGSGNGEDSTTDSTLENSDSSEPPFLESSPPLPEQSSEIPESTSENELTTTEWLTVEPVQPEESKKARKFHVDATTKPEVPKETEEINEHQSNISNTVHTELADDAKKIESMPKSNAGNVEESTPGESAENPARASKDTKILIVLFVAVVIIGIGAFLYNFIKKKRQSAAITNENAPTKNEDPERGQEMKPLMKGKLENGEKQDNGKSEMEIEKNETDKVTV